MRAWTWVTCAVWAALGVSACGPPPEDPAVEAFKGFDRAIRSGEAPEVWAALTRESREEIRRSLGLPDGSEDDAVLARLGVRPGWPFEMELPPRIKVDPSQTSEERRVLVVRYPSKEWRVTMRRTADGWRVDLFDAEPPSGR